MVLHIGKKPSIVLLMFSALSFAMAFPKAQLKQRLFLPCSILLLTVSIVLSIIHNDIVNVNICYMLLEYIARFKLFRLHAITRTRYTVANFFQQDQ